MNVVDIIIIAIIAIFVILGYVRGFVNSIVSLLGIVVGFLCGRWFYEPVATKLMNVTNIHASITKWVAERLTPTMANNATSTANLISGPKALADWFRGLVSASGGSVDQVASSIAELIIHSLCFLAIFILVIIVINLIGLLLNKFAKVRGINLLNKVGGLVVGAAKGLLLCAVVISVIYLFTAFNESSAIGQLLKQSFLADWFYIGNWLF